jgi:hypothetical protein
MFDMNPLIRMNILRLFGKKASYESPEEEIRQIEFKLRHGYSVDREKLEARKRELEKLIAQRPKQG